MAKTLTLISAIKNALTPREKALSPLPSYKNGWRKITEPFAGAWQRGVEETRADIVTYPTLYACQSLPSQDIGKLPFMLMKEQGNIWVKIENPAYTPVLRKPNHYQTAAQFRECWILSKLGDGNSYVLKGRDNRGVVTSLYVLDPCRTRPLISESGQVFYELSKIGWQNLPPIPPGITENESSVIVPASEIIHDRFATVHHQLVGVPPLYAAYWPTVKNLKILRNATQFFANGAQPGGILTAPAGMSEPDADAVKAYWNENFAGENSGKVAVIGADMKFTSFAFKSVDSQMVEQMKYSDQQIAQAFKIKPYKVGIEAPPSGWKSDDINVEYHDSCLSPLIEAMEDLLGEGLKIPSGMRVQLDASPLWRMDQGKLAEVATKLVSGKIYQPDEGRAMFNKGPVPGGDTLWGQHQDYPLGILAERDDLASVNDQPAPNEPEEIEEPETSEEDQTDKALFFLWKKSPESYCNA